METNIIINTLSNLTSDILYFSDSESPFIVGNWEKIPLAGLPQKIAAEHKTDVNRLKVLDPKIFFDGLLAKVDLTDQPMVENVQKIYAFYQYAQKNLSNLQVTRVEGATRIPIFITGYLPDGNCIAIQTLAVET